MSNNFPAWKTIKIGTHPDVESLKEAILDAGFYMIGEGRVFYIC